MIYSQLLGSSCSFLVEKETWSIRFYTSFFRMVIWLRSTCRSPEKYILTISSFLIIMYKDVVYLLVLISGLCGCIQSVLKSTCPWNNIKNVDHLICPKSFISEFNTSLICSWLWLNDFSPSSKLFNASLLCSWLWPCGPFLLLYLQSRYYYSHCISGGYFISWKTKYLG